MKRIFVGFVGLLCVCTAYARQYWDMDSGKTAITWHIEPGKSHYDHVEMSGKQVSVVLRYGVDDEGRFSLEKSVVWPMLRTVPNNTHASLNRRFSWTSLDAVTVNGRAYKEKVTDVTLNGTLVVNGELRLGKDDIVDAVHTYLPSTEHPSLVEWHEFTNRGKRNVTLEIPEMHTVVHTEKSRGTWGSYLLVLATHCGGTFVLKPGETCGFGASVSGYKPGESERTIRPEEELKARLALVDGWSKNLVLETPEPVVDRMFAFSKIRALESIYATSGGPMHGPGGESYYAAIWANDQAEYINPYFPYTGYDYGNLSAINSFRHFARFMNKEWKPIPSSIVAEGIDIWNGAGDRGDAAMIAYGASRFALANGDREEAENLWPLIEWCLEYCHRKLNEEGVVTSDSDELEGRFPAGKANLCTSSLYYDALLSAACLAEDLGKGSTTARKYRQQASALRRAIHHYFAATVEGFDTYAYYKGNDVLRAWICIPLTTGIDERAKGTLDALFSSRLWTENGLLTQAGSDTFWDRSTLYGLRGAFAAGATEKAMNFLKHYSETRLLGEHVPYAVEAWPEGNQRHLSAESGLYGRIVTEGLFGIRPTGLHTFTLTPRLPAGWDKMALRHIRAFGADFDIEVKRAGAGRLYVTVRNKGRVVWSKRMKEGVAAACRL